MEELTEEICKQCGKKLIEDDKIFDGYCEKCWNKWIKEKRKPPKVSNNYDSQNIISTFSCLCSLISIGIVIIESIIYVISIPFLLINAITLFQASQFLEPVNELSVATIILYSIKIIFAILAIVLGIIAIKKGEKSKSANIGIIISLISISHTIISIINMR